MVSVETGKNYFRVFTPSITAAIIGYFLHFSILCKE